MGKEKKVLNLAMQKKYNNKMECLRTAREIMKEKKITGMSVTEIASEIFFHAFFFYNFNKLPGLIRNTSLFKRFYHSAEDGIDLEDNGDTFLRKLCYSFAWTFFTSKPV